MRTFLTRLLASHFQLDDPSDISGPYILSGGWWAGGVHRDYYFMRTAAGDLWWCYYDHRQQRVFLQGGVE